MNQNEIVQSPEGGKCEEMTTLKRLMTFGQGEPEATQEKRSQQNKCPNPLACWSMFNSWLSGKFLKFMVSAHFFWYINSFHDLFQATKVITGKTELAKDVHSHI